MKDLTSNGLKNIISQAIEEIKAEQGESFSLENINLAELQRRTGVSRGKLRTLKNNHFQFITATRRLDPTVSVLYGFTDFLDNLLRQGISSATICTRRLTEIGYLGSETTVRRYINKHKDLIPAKRYIVAPQGSRGRRFVTRPGEAFQMDWGFANVLDYDGSKYKVACFAMVCHHCGQRYIEFFPNAKQESLFIGILHAFEYLGVPEYVLTDNMKSVVIRRDFDGHPIWQKDYESFMQTVGFRTKLCKPRHPFTKGKVERLVRFVKDNFLLGRTFTDISDLNNEAIRWCLSQNNKLQRASGAIPSEMHTKECSVNLKPFNAVANVTVYLCPERRISFDGFINYEGRRFGVPFAYAGSTARVMRKDEKLYIYSTDMSQLLTIHDITWSKRDRYCNDQYSWKDEPEEFPTATVKTTISRTPEDKPKISFEKFNFDKEVE